VSLISKLVPNRFHSTVVGKAQQERQEKDVFPTLYRCNTKAKISRTLKRHGFDYCVYGHEGPPTYLQFSRFAYGVGVVHQRLVPDLFKHLIFAFARKH
jgi:hypothetical protein